MKLVSYGIQTEESNIRIHVCPLVKRVYLYETSNGARVMTHYPKRTASQVVNGRSVITAEGYIVPVVSIPECREIELPDALWTRHPITEWLSTSVKGERAVNIVRDAIKSRLITIPVQVAIIDDFDLQIQGTDIIVQCHFKIQVKCDYRGGSKALGGTGNLFLQIAEINPLKAV